MKSALLTIILVISIGFTIKGQNVRLGKVIVSPRIYANYHCFLPLKTDPLLPLKIDPLMDV